MSALIDSIYEAAAIPERWLPVLEDLAQVAGCHGTTLFTVDAAQNVRALNSSSMHTIMAIFARDGWMQRNPRAARLAAKRYPGFATDLDLFTPEEMDRDPFYTEFLRP